MRVLILENNLMWSPRLANGLRALGHEPIVVDKLGEALPEAEAAIINLGVPVFVEAVAALEASGVRTTGHAGHKEKDLMELGKAAGCSRLVTNSQLAHKLSDYFPPVIEP